MTTVFISVGSNIEREKNIHRGVDALRVAYGELSLSSVYQSRAVGFEGDDFYNLVLSFESDQSVASVATTLREIETRYGRVRSSTKFSSRTLDLDILLFGQEDYRAQGLDIPRAEIAKYAHVLQPLAELVPEQCHPLCGERYQQLWTQFEVPAHTLWRVPFDWG
ncbi:MAG: 2-amino-4-hydroxy-6-hydroxymethyldihydropteridine diphosphokinase [Gammaproteobacteria bacterium]|nr:2-amino-4-hydroxy-6-hydroxymethyldihydropteridine diphosphokinase [Gammaproteobacteria bacterium]MCF6231404.1 2-amino-4-hydroxy-6-hydroxymethyldihydropteridine diphosphokinase [Gammaproteobacteria bacterium]